MLKNTFPRKNRYTTWPTAGFGQFPAYMKRTRRYSGAKKGGFKKPRRTAATKSRARNVRTGGFLGLENKFFDVEDNADAFTTSWATMEPTTTDLTAIGQGDGESNRDGRKYEITSIHIKGFIRRPATESNTGPVSDSLCRIALVWDQQTNGAELTATDVMDASGTNDEQAFRNLQFTRRFRVLYDKRFRVNANQGGMNEGAINLFANGGIVIPFKINKTFKTPIQVTMSGTTADIANVTDNSIHLIGCASDALCTLSYQCRTRFRG